VADACGHNFHWHLSGARAVQIDFFDAQRLIDFAGDRDAGLHGWDSRGVGSATSMAGSDIFRTTCARTPACTPPAPRAEAHEADR
jgi:hypothetical protein